MLKLPSADASVELRETAVRPVGFPPGSKRDIA